MRGYSVVGLYNPKSETNIGGAMRAAGCYDAKLVVIEGTRFKRCKTDTQKAWKHIPTIRVEHNCHTEEPAILKVTPFDCKTVAVEITEDAISLDVFQHPERAFYIFGPEDGSLHWSVMMFTDYTVKIPTKYCMNLAATVNVVLYDRLAKQLRTEKKEKQFGLVNSKK